MNSVVKDIVTGIGEERGYALLASILAAIGLSNNSYAGIIGSMLVSPISSPIVDIYLKDNDVSENVKDLAVLVTVCVAVGVIYYMILYKILGGTFEMNDEMRSRSEWKGKKYIFDFMYAVVGGMAVYIAYDSNIAKTNINAIVGVGIGASLLPPLVNSGMLLGASLDGYSLMDGAKSSFILTVINIVGLSVGFHAAKLVNV